MQYAAGLEPLQQRVAIPRLDDPRDGVGPRGVFAPGNAEAEEGGHDRQPQPLAARDEVLDRGQHAVALPALLARLVPVRQPAGPHPGHAREQAGPLVDRPAVLGRDHLGVVVVVAAGVRPGDVVEQQQRERAVAGALGDQAQLLAHRVVVVVAVDDRRVGYRYAAQRVVARLAEQLELRMGALELDKRCPRTRVDGRDADAAAGSPAHERSGQVARVGPHLDHRPHLRGLEQREDQLGEREQRGAPVAGVIRVRIDIERRHGARQSKDHVRVAAGYARTLRGRPPRRTAPAERRGRLRYRAVRRRDLLRAGRAHRVAGAAGGRRRAAVDGSRDAAAGPEAGHGRAGRVPVRLLGARTDRPAHWAGGPGPAGAARGWRRT